MENEPPHDSDADGQSTDAAEGSKSRQGESKPGESGSRETGPRKPSPYIFMSAGIEFTAVTSALAGIGWWLDGKWGTDPYLMIVGLAMGLVGGTYKLWRLGRIFFR